MIYIETKLAFVYQGNVHQFMIQKDRYTHRYQILTLFVNKPLSCQHFLPITLEDKVYYQLGIASVTAVYFDWKSLNFSLFFLADL